MKIVDSVGWIEYLGRGPLADEYDNHFDNPRELLTPTIILFEVHKYVLRMLGPGAAENVTSMALDTCVVPLTEGIARLAAQQSVEHKLPMADAIIYATAVAYGATLITSDAHFQGLPQVGYIPRPST